MKKRLKRAAGIRLDEDTFMAAVWLAESLYEGNLSQALRHCVRTVAGGALKGKGITEGQPVLNDVEFDPAERPRGQGGNHEQRSGDEQGAENPAWIDSHTADVSGGPDEKA